jgi:hypothetical protein
MQCICPLFSCVLCPDVQIFKIFYSTIKMCSIFSITFVWNISPYKNKRARYDNKCVLVSGPVPVILAKVSWNINFSTDYFTNIQINVSLNSLHSSRVVPCGRTDRTKLIAAFRNFATAPTITMSCKIENNVCMPDCESLFPNTSDSLQTHFAKVSHLMVAHFITNGLARNKKKRFWLLYWKFEDLL